MANRSLMRSITMVILMASGLAVARPALAGTCRPLCRTLDITDARSLPWGTEWWSGQPTYILPNLVAETEALLGASTSAIARMETLRRASIYASRDHKVAEQLFARILERARASERAGRPDAIAFFDAAYAATMFSQISDFRGPEVGTLSAQVKALVAGVDEYALVTKSLALRPDDPELHFGAALIASLREEHHQFCAGHARKARDGAAGHPLLVRNLHHVS